MRGKKLSSELRAALAIVTVLLFATTTWANDEKVLHSFGSGTDGINPSANLIFDAAGNLYGTTTYGGIHTCTDYDGKPGCGTVFELSPREDGGWTETVLHSFGRGTDGTLPSAGLVSDSAGNLYGTTSAGGIHDNCPYFYYDTCGTVFELSPREDGGWAETVLHSFGNGSDGQTPTGSLIFDAAGNLYGTTNYGGIHGAGTVFELSPRQNGGWTETVLHSFGDGEKDGTYPTAGLIFDAVGNLYGTTWDGGIRGYGAVFELSPREGGWTETVLYSFGQKYIVSDGQWPETGLVIDAAGNLYGTTINGGIHLIGCNPSACGTVFKLSPNEDGGWTETLLHSFGGGTDGKFPGVNLIFDAAGNLYGTTDRGGIHLY